MTHRSRPIHAIPPRAVAAGMLLPPRATSDGTLRRLQEAALIGFCERGYHGVSTRDLADAIGVRPSSVYAHVAAKEDLLVELMLIGHAEHNDRLRQALLASGPDPADQIQALVSAHVGVHGTYPLLTRVCNKELHALSEANAQRVTALRRDSEQLFLSVVERGLEQGSFHCPDAWLATAAIGAMGIRVAEWFDPAGGVDLDEVAAAYAMFALKLLA